MRPENSLHFAKFLRRFLYLSTIAGGPRFYALDSLRAALMLLGIVIHASCSYVSFDLGEAWHYKDRASVSPVLDLVLTFIHIFRMPLFFVLAGFFARMVFEKRGLREFLWNRWRRIMIPFVAGWAVLYVPLNLGFHYGVAPAGTPGSRVEWAWSRLGLLDTTMHLWFLNYLIWFYAAGCLAALLFPRGSATSFEVAEAAFRRIAQSPVLRVLIPGALTMGTLWFMKTGTLDTSLHLIPETSTLIAYGIFYLFGWMMWTQRDLLDSFRRFAALQTLTGTLLVPVTVGALLQLKPDGSMRGTPQHLTAISTGAIAVWLLIFGVSGLFIRYVRTTGPVARYLADASYWMYLAHLPFIIWLNVLLEPLRAPGLVKFGLVLVITVAIVLATYEWFVRRSIIGKYLNGSASQAQPEPLKPVAMAAAGG